jgi:hypothetical protein
MIDENNLTTENFVTFLSCLLVSAFLKEGINNHLIRSFSAAGVMTKDQGMVVRIGKTEFQITIVRSR